MTPMQELKFKRISQIWASGLIAGVLHDTVTHAAGLPENFTHNFGQAIVMLSVASLVWSFQKRIN